MSDDQGNGGTNFLLIVGGMFLLSFLNRLAELRGRRRVFTWNTLFWEMPVVATCAVTGWAIAEYILGVPINSPVTFAIVAMVSRMGPEGLERIFWKFINKKGE